MLNIAKENHLINRLFFIGFLLLMRSPLFGELNSSEEDFSDKIVSFILVKDFDGAKTSCETAIKIFPDSAKLKGLYIRILSEGGKCDEALSVFKKERIGKDLSENFDLLENLAWGVLQQKNKESELGTLASLIGAYLTHDARAVSLIHEGLQSQNALLRSISAQFSSQYNDLVLQKEIVRLLREETNWFVKKEVIEAVGKMRLKECESDLKEMVGSRSVTAEEKGAAIKSLVMMHNDVSNSEIEELAKNKRAGFRELGVVLIDHFEKKEEVEKILPLLGDASPSVRIRVLALLGSMAVDVADLRASEKKLIALSEDLNTEVAMLADWVLLRIDPDRSRIKLKKWICSKNPKTARFAASVIGAGGMETLPIMEESFSKAEDPYVKAILAYAMLQQGVNVPLASQYLKGLLIDKKEKIVVTEGVYPCFTMIMPSEVRHIPGIPMYPEMVDQLARLKILNALSIAGVSDLKEIAKAYLQGQVWGVVGSAAVFFLEEAELSSIDLVRELLDDEDQSVRIQAALALAFYGGERRAAKVLEEAYAKVDWDKKISILEAIGHVGLRESIPFLLSVLEEPFTLPRIIAASSIIQCLYH